MALLQPGTARRSPTVAQSSCPDAPLGGTVARAAAWGSNGCLDLVTRRRIPVCGNPSGRPLIFRVRTLLTLPSWEALVDFYG